MSRTSEERVAQALEHLIERTVPIYPEDDEAAADERLDEAYAFAREIIGRQANLYSLGGHC